MTLATQCSANHLHHVVMQITRWSGPISVAVFAPDDQASFATDAILSMSECWPEIKKRVTFHLVYPTNHVADLSASVGKIDHDGCEDLLQKISSCPVLSKILAGGVLSDDVEGEVRREVQFVYRRSFNARHPIMN